MSETKLCFIFQLCVWNTDSWEKRKSKLLQVPTGQPSVALSETRVQFHQDQTRLLVTHESQLAIYDAAKLELIKQVSIFFLQFGPCSIKI